MTIAVFYKIFVLVMSALSTTSIICDKTRILQQFISINNLRQCSTIANDMNRKLDLVISNFDKLELKKCLTPLVGEDLYHLSLCILLTVKER